MVCPRCEPFTHPLRGAARPYLMYNTAVGNESGTTTIVTRIPSGPKVRFGHTPQISHILTLLRGTTVNRTYYTVHTQTFIFACFYYFNNNIWSNLLWSPVIELFFPRVKKCLQPHGPGRVGFRRCSDSDECRVG